MNTTLYKYVIIMFYLSLPCRPPFRHSYMGTRGPSAERPHEYYEDRRKQ